MIKRTVEVSNPSHLRLCKEQMVVEREGKEVASIPLEDLGVLVLDHPAISHTHGLLAACGEGNVAVVVCNDRHLPSALLLPLAANTLHTRVLGEQLGATEAVKNRLWQRIVQAKIEAQAQALERSGGDTSAVEVYVQKVKAGDPDNIEGQAARAYFPRLFGSGFQRNPELDGINAALNYGYAIIRASMARAVVGTGLHPALGIHHHNQYDAFALADDLMEPLRPVVDLAVWALSRENPKPKITPETKRELLGVLSAECTVAGRRYPILEATHLYAAGVRRVLCEAQKHAEIPRI